MSTPREAPTTVYRSGVSAGLHDPEATRFNRDQAVRPTIAGERPHSQRRSSADNIKKLLLHIKTASRSTTTRSTSCLGHSRSSRLPMTKHITPSPRRQSPASFPHVTLHIPTSICTYQKIMTVNVPRYPSNSISLDTLDYSLCYVIRAVNAAPAASQLWYIPRPS